MRFPPITIDSWNVVFFVPKQNRMCNQIFPPAPTIRCQRALGHPGTCVATKREPYYQLSWEISGFTKKES